MVPLTLALWFFVASTGKGHWHPRKQAMTKVCEENFANVIMSPLEGEPETITSDETRNTRCNNGKTTKYATEEEVEAMTNVTPGERDDMALYRSGIGTLRSSAHRVKGKPKHRKQNPNPKNKSGNETTTTNLPDSMYKEQILGFDTSKYNLRGAFTELLQRCDADTVGSFRNQEEPALEDFVLPVNTLNRKIIGGCLEATQTSMSAAVAADENFLQIFDRLVEEIILPHLKQRLVEAGAVKEEQSLSFYIQRPPTLRLQPGPGRAGVKPHHDGEYGHQNGELNFWLPLTDRGLNQVDLWCESSHMSGDYHAIVAHMGEIISFHGSSCRHFVNRNDSDKTRMSMDFRIGVEGFFDPFWMMKGTTADHGRREVRR